MNNMNSSSSASSSISSAFSSSSSASAPAPKSSAAVDGAAASTTKSVDAFAVAALFQGPVAAVAPAPAVAVAPTVVPAAAVAALLTEQVQKNEMLPDSVLTLKNFFEDLEKAIQSKCTDIYEDMLDRREHVSEDRMREVDSSKYTFSEGCVFLDDDNGPRNLCFLKYGKYAYPPEFGSSIVLIKMHFCFFKADAFRKNQEFTVKKASDNPFLKSLLIKLEELNKLMHKYAINYF